MNEEINKIINWIEISYTRLNYKEELLLVNYIKQLQQKNARLKDKLKDIEKILESNHDVEHVYCALSQYLNIFDYELDLEDYLKEN